MCPFKNSCSTSVDNNKAASLTACEHSDKLIYFRFSYKNQIKYKHIKAHQAQQYISSIILLLSRHDTNMPVPVPVQPCLLRR